MKSSYVYEVMPQEIDMHRRLRLYTLENILLTVAGRDSDEHGYGIQHLLPYNYTWVIVRLHLQMKYIPTHNEHIRVETWVEQNAHMLSTRNYRVYLIAPTSHNERLIGRATSVWAVLDLDKREIVNAFDMPMFANTVDGETINMPKAPRLTPILTPTGIVPHTIQYSDCDYNRHCNSCKYLERMMDAYPVNVQNKCISLTINYLKEVKFEEHIRTIFLTSSQSAQYQQVDEIGHTLCTCRIDTNNELDF